MLLHFIGALFGGGAFSLIFVFGSEIVGPSSRGLGAGVVSNAVSVGQILLAVVTMFVTDFRVLLRLMYGMVALTLTFVWLIPESVRWLFSIGKYSEGVKILVQVTKWNGTKLPVDTLNGLRNKNKNEAFLSKRVEGGTNKYSVKTALKSSILRNRLINCCYCFFTNALIYFGLSVYSSSLPGNKHMNLLYAGTIELPGNAATHYVLLRYGRKWSLIVSMIACSLACIASELFADPMMKIALFLVGKFSVALSYTILSLYVIELFPTNVRQSMFNICMVFAGCGNIAAPLLPLSVGRILRITLLSFN